MPECSCSTACILQGCWSTPTTGSRGFAWRGEPDARPLLRKRSSMRPGAATWPVRRVAASALRVNGKSRRSGRQRAGSRRRRRAGRGLAVTGERARDPLPLWRHHLTGTVDIRVPGTLAELEVAARRRCFHRDQAFSSDALFFLPPERLQTGATHCGPVAAETFSLAALQAAPGLTLLSPSGDLDDDAAAALIESGTFLGVGDRLGRKLAAEPVELVPAGLRVRCDGAQSIDGVAFPPRDRRGLPVLRVPPRSPAARTFRDWGHGMSLSSAAAPPAQRPALLRRGRAGGCWLWKLSPRWGGWGRKGKSPATITATGQASPPRSMQG